MIAKTRQTRGGPHWAERSAPLLLLAKTIERVARVTALAVVLVFGVPLAEADESSVWQAFDRPAVSLLSGVQGCATALRDGASEGY